MALHSDQKKKKKPLPTMHRYKMANSGASQDSDGLTIQQLELDLAHHERIGITWVRVLLLAVSLA